MDSESIMEKLVLEFFNINVIKFGSFKLKSGIDSPIYLDLRIIVSFPNLMDSLSDLLLHLVNSCEKHVNHICGVPYTALPLATLVSAKSKISMLIRRKEKKNHGTGKIIEGKFNKGDKCVIIEDVVSSGSSIIETVEDLEKEGLKVTSALVVLDREQGGVKNLESKGIKVYVLTSITQVLKILLKHMKISENTVKEVEKYIWNNKIKITESGFQTITGGVNKRLVMRFSDRAKLTRNKLTVKIFELMESKKTLLCLAADVNKTSDLLRLANQVGPHICILKTHFDALEDFSKESFYELLKVAKKCNFLIMEDRKFSDIGNTVSLQYNQIKDWADLITAHSTAGEGIITALKSCIEGSTEKGCFLVAQLSCDGQLIDKEYTFATLKMAEGHDDFVVGLVCQSPDIIKVPNFIQLTPGVNIKEKSDSLGQNYNDPDFVVLEQGADIAVVGRGITLSSDPEKVAITYKERLWNAYQKRIAFY